MGIGEPLIRVPGSPVYHSPCLDVKHVEGVELVCHPQVDEPRVIHPKDPLVEAVGPEPVSGLEPQAVGHEGEVVLVSCAEDDQLDGVNFVRRTVGKVS